MDRDTLLMLILVPVFIIGLQKYIEIRGSYRPPTKDEVEKIKSKSGASMAGIVNAIPRLRYAILIAATVDAYGFGLSMDSQWKWVFVAAMIPCIIAMSLLVNWRMIAKP